MCAAALAVGKYCYLHRFYAAMQIAILFIIWSLLARQADSENLSCGVSCNSHLQEAILKMVFVQKKLVTKNVHFNYFYLNDF